MDRVLEVYRDHFWEFYNEQPESVRDKIDYVIQIIISMDRIPKKFFKHVDEGIYEIRIERDGNIYRIFSFFDESKLVILLHGFQKKMEKLPAK